MRKMAGMGFAVIIFTAFMNLLSGCGKNSMEEEYAAIKDSGLGGEPLLESLSEFELRNMGHFNSKIDLGGYYLLAGNLEIAGDYFRRAEAVVKTAPADGETKKNTAIMYGSLARLHSIQGDYDAALEYAEKAAAGDDEEALPYAVPYRYLQGHIFLEKGENERALEVFDLLFKTHAGAAVGDDIRAYMYLLAEAARWAEAAAMVDLFFEKGGYFPGLGLFASSVYEAAGQEEKAVYAAFLEYEYSSGYREAEPAVFLKNIETLEKQLAARDRSGPVTGALNLVRSLYDPSVSVSITEQYEYSFFAEEYITLKKRISEAPLTAAEFSRYLGMEHYFSLFPVYYWNLWQAVSGLPESSRANYLMVLERIIALDREGAYAQRAWDEISKTLGFKSSKE